MARPPPPPPPNAAPPPPVPSTDDHRSDTEEEVTEYEADYDTDMANKVAHRDALKAQHGKDKAEVEDDTPIQSPTATPPQVPTRAVPPLPPTTSLPPSARQSVDMPRAPPPAPPPQPPAVPPVEEDDNGYDPYRYDPGSQAPGSPPPPPQTAGSMASMGSLERPGTGRSQPRRSMDTPRPPGSRSSMDTPPRSSGGRRSMDQSRPFNEHIARDLELSPESRWWTTPDTLPPSLSQRAKDLIFEAEESSSTRRGGRTTITRDIYILFHDYSQTILTVRYDRDDPINTASFEQRHEPPPPQLRQDQLEENAQNLGAKIFGHVKAKEQQTVGDGEPHSLIVDAFTSVPNVLPPVGHRGYGALVYANLANASVQQYDEIRPGDIITFRNAKFQGHKGGLHQKYSMEVGKPDHVAIVADWDGTKKKVRAYEQGREKKKVTIEGYRMADLKSGEAKVWRVVGRDWVGWD